MNLKTCLFACIFVLTTFSCEKDLQNTKKSENTSYLIGTWINPQYSDNNITYSRTDSLTYNNYGFSFNPNGVFIERKNSGWCGTPPISYADYEGTWIKNDSILNITVPFWGGMQYYKWKIILIDKYYLSLTVISTDDSIIY